MNQTIDLCHNVEESHLQYCFVVGLRRESCCGEERESCRKVSK